MAKRKGITAAELLANLQSDPEWVRRNAEREARQKAETLKLLQEQRPLLVDLADAGHAVESVWDLVNTNASYPAAVPVLCKHLQRPYHPRTREGIARALTVPEARGDAGRVLLEELKSQKDPSGSEARWALANALTVAADRSMVEELKALIADASYEDVHERLKTALKKLRVK